MNYCNICKDIYKNTCWKCFQQNATKIYPKCKKKRKLCQQNDCKICYEKSFASYTQQIILSNEMSNVCLIFYGGYKLNCWDYEKNKITPRQTFKSSNKKFLFKCNECKHNFDTRIAHVTNSGRWCPYCGNKKLCDSDDCKSCNQKSFASHEKSKYWDYEKNKITPRQTFKSSRKKFLFKCNECKHNFDTRLNDVTNSNNWCPYCGNQKLCDSYDCKSCNQKSFASHEKSKYWDYEKNKTTPRQAFKSSGKKFLFKCNECKHSFDTTLSHVTNSGSWCPHCKNKTERRVYEFLREIKFNVVKPFSPDWSVNPVTGRKLPYDMCVIYNNSGRKCVIEVDGRQHFEEIKHFDREKGSFEKRQERDNLKMANLETNKIHLIRICQEYVYNSKDDIWKNDLKESLDEIKNYKGCDILSYGISIDGRYEEYF